MITLGLDPSLTGFGWCIIDTSQLGEKRLVARGVLHDPKGIFVQRYAMHRAALTCLLDQHPEVEAVGVESPPFGEQFSEGLYALFVFVNEAIYLSRKNVVYFDPQSVKRLTRMDPTVRKGTMDKSDMVDAAKAETGIKRWNHNEADAYLIARSAAHFWELESGIITREDLTPAEIQAYHSIRTISRGDRAGLTEHRGLLFRENSRYFKFSNIPPDDEEEEFRRWLCQKGAKTLTAAVKPPSPKKRRKVLQ